MLARVGGVFPGCNMVCFPGRLLFMLARCEGLVSTSPSDGDERTLEQVVSRRIRKNNAQEIQQFQPLAWSRNIANYSNPKRYK